eukprot:TRINITY_DN10048_c0_g1_i1.p1 TRINITY_DN10048_c0_g1~~TRINITY_DN10048_c0_g1_i1.p1  ORF type:complete len:165 (-),score=33.53 TRINITY_DN10048_c0_g1_i1:78-572(-)
MDLHPPYETELCWEQCSLGTTVLEEPRGMIAVRNKLVIVESNAVVVFNPVACLCQRHQLDRRCNGIEHVGVVHQQALYCFTHSMLVQINLRTFAAQVIKRKQPGDRSHYATNAMTTMFNGKLYDCSTCCGGQEWRVESFRFRDERWDFEPKINADGGLLAIFTY